MTMARSHSIHIVSYGSLMVRAFTVKHEAKAYLEKAAKAELEDYKVTSFRDGGSVIRYQQSAKDFMNGKH